MRDYWDDRARENAVWFVDTSLRYDDPDMDRFWEAGEQIVATALDDVPCVPAGHALAVEIGSGLGRVCRALASRFESVIGIDVSPEMVERARSLVPDPRIRFDVGDGATLRPLDDGIADLVLSFTVFQHIPSTAVIERYIEDAGRVLRPGGVFSFQWNNTPHPRRWALRRQAHALLGHVGIGRGVYGTNDPAFLGSRVPLRRIEQALRRGGLDLCHTERLGELFAWAWAVKRA